MLARSPDATWEYTPESEAEAKEPAVFTLGQITVALENKVMASGMRAGRFDDSALIGLLEQVLNEGLRGWAGIKSSDGAAIPFNAADPIGMQSLLDPSVRMNLGFRIFNGAKLTEQESE